MGRAGLTVGLNNLQGLFQARRFKVKRKTVEKELFKANSFRKNCKKKLESYLLYSSYFLQCSKIQMSDDLILKTETK